MTKQPTRLNKNLALWLGISRRQADDMIAANRVKVDNQVAVLGQRVLPDSVITVDNKPITKNVKLALIKLHKPTSYTCSRRQQGNAPTIYQLLPDNLHQLKPVGRLDKDSSGLLLLTNDGDLAYRLTHPKFKKVKTYHATLDRDLEPLHQQMISDHGIQLGDGKSRLILTRLDENSRRRWQVEMSEGRNRQIRRTFQALGYQVIGLHRISFGNYQLHDLKSGQYEHVKDYQPDNRTHSNK